MCIRDRGKAAVITVQTDTMRQRLGAQWGIPDERFHIVPNGPSAFLAGEAPAEEEASGPPTILVVAEAKPAKNLEVLPAVARELLDMGLGDVRIVVTVGPPGAAYAGPLDAAMAREGRDLPIDRVGRVAHEALGDLYRSASVVFLPSHFESFSATYLEAMHFGIPLVTSDLDFGRDLCADAALYVDPTDPGDCARTLMQALEDPAERRRLRDAGFRRLEAFPDWDDRFGRYLAALERAVLGADRGRLKVPVSAPVDV